MIFHVYGYANPTQGLFQCLEDSGHSIYPFGPEDRDGKYSVFYALQEPNIFENLSKPGFHFFTRFESCISKINKTLKKADKGGRRIAHITYGWKAFNRIKDRLNFSNFDYIFCCNKVYVRKLKDMGISAYFMPNTIDPSNINFVGHVPDTDFNLLAYSLRFSPAKNYPNLIKFFSQLLSKEDRLHLTIRAVKSSDKICSQQESKVRNLIRKFSIDDKVTLLTYPLNTNKQWRKSYGDANRLLPNNAMYISYSKWESFGYAIAEAMLAGKQVFVKGWSTPLKPSQFWGDSVYTAKEQMMEGILEHARCSQDEKIRVAKENREFVEQRYAPEVAVNCMLEILGNSQCL